MFFFSEGMECQGAIYHNLLSKSVLVDGIELYAYVVMNNHYHLALRTSGGTLSKVMHWINTGYNMKCNRDMKRRDMFFRENTKPYPYKMKII